MRKSITILFAFLVVTFLQETYSQSSTCIDSEPFCTGTNYVFPASVNAGQAEVGPDYGCLSSQPNPVWYHLLIDDSGDLEITMFSTPEKDIDFICWGPFDDPTSPCPYGLDDSHIVSCSYSISSTEVCSIDDAVSGEYYILMITNYSNNACNINFSQTGGDGSTDCSILPPQISSNSPICEGETLLLMAATVEDAQYIWSGPNNFSSTQQNPNIPNATADYQGEYSLIIIINGLESDPITIDVYINEHPDMTAGDDIEIPYGTNTQLDGSVVGDVSDFDYLWQPMDSLLDATIIDPTTVNLEATTQFELTVTNNETECYSKDTTVVFITGSALSAVITAVGNEVCIGEDIVLNVEASGGTENYTYLWTSDPEGFTSQMCNPTVSPHVTTTYFVAVNDGYNTTNAQYTIYVNPLPILNAGEDISIPFGTSTQLLASVDGNIDDVTFFWEPENMLLDATVINPHTVNMEASTEFEFAATNIQTGCSASDNVVVNVTGGAVSTIIIADVDEICSGGSVVLRAQASGGSGEYTYSWYSDPAGFSSTLYNPTVVPTVTTTYFVTVDDGYNSVIGQYTIVVNPLPIANAGEDITIPYGTDTQLQGSATSGTGGCSFDWNNEEFLLNDNVPNPKTIVLEQEVNFSLCVTDEKGCVSESDKVNISLTGGALSVLNSYAMHPEICIGDSTMLIAIASGGSGNYSYIWQDSDGNIISEESEKEVHPNETSIYRVIVNDGYNSVNSDIAVCVHSLPVIDLTPVGYTPIEDIIQICIFDTVLLDAGNDDFISCSYLWNDGYNERYRDVGTTGISFDIKEYSVKVNVKYNEDLTCSNTDDITLIFNYAQCVGVDEIDNDDITLFPVPSDGIIHVTVNNWHDDIFVSVVNIVGKEVYKSEEKVLYDGKAKFDINLSGYKNGVYFVKIYNQEKVIKAKVLIQ